MYGTPVSDLEPKPEPGARAETSFCSGSSQKFGSLELRHHNTGHTVTEKGKTNAIKGEKYGQ
jgi:hypothetical protein